METEIKQEAELKTDVESPVQNTEQAVSKESKLSVPMAIVVAGALIAGAIYFSSVSKNQAPSNLVPEGNALLQNIRPVSKQEHIRGNPNAPVKIVEYSDTECPFCQRFHFTMKQIMTEYGEDGKVAWVYRHSPLDQLHPKARKEAEATECANELGGNDVFWRYLDRLYEITPANNGLPEDELPKIAEYVGLDVTNFNACLASGKYADYIQKDLENAVATGGGGTPWSILVAKNGKKYSINGAQPYETVKQTIENALK